MLMDRTGKITLATTDPDRLTIFLSYSIPEDLFEKVLIHELSHCVMFSYNLIEYIHDIVYPEYWIEAEERVCNFVASYGKIIFDNAYSIIGNDAYLFIPYKIDKIIK